MISLGGPLCCMPNVRGIKGKGDRHESELHQQHGERVELCAGSMQKCAKSLSGGCFVVTGSAHRVLLTEKASFEKALKQGQLFAPPLGAYTLAQSREVCTYREYACV